MFIRVIVACLLYFMMETSYWLPTA